MANGRLQIQKDFAIETLAKKVLVLMTLLSKQVRTIAATIKLLIEAIRWEKL